MPNGLEGTRTSLLIRKLAQLRDEGLVTDEEFETKRAELLANL